MPFTPFNQLVPGAPNGLATLDATGLVPLSELPIAVVSLLLEGAGVPASGLGFNGDAYVNLSTGQLYAKASGAWGQNALVFHGQLAATPTAGFVLQNATPTILTWTAPNDGLNHRVTAVGELVVTTLEAGGQVNLNYTDPAGNVRSPGVILLNGAQGVGVSLLSGQARIMVAPNTTVTVAQGSALTSGGSTLFCELWGS